MAASPLPIASYRASRASLRTWRFTLRAWRLTPRLHLVSAGRQSQAAAARVSGGSASRPLLVSRSHLEKSLPLSL